MEDIDIKQLDDAVRVIKSAILRAQTKAVKSTNATLLSLYYGIGRFVSINSRSGFWGTGAIKAISEQLQNELPGLRGFSEENIKKMRSFYEKWEGLTNRSPMATDLQKIWLCSVLLIKGGDNEINKYGFDPHNMNIPLNYFCRRAES